MAELSDADKEFIKELREAKEDKSLTRREALSVAGGVLGGGVLGAAGTVETASADASTTDSDGNVGLPDDRVDVFAEGVDSISIDVGQINSAVQVRSEAELDEAIANNEEVIRISGNFVVSGTKTYGVEGGRIYGSGGYDTGTATIVGDGISGDFAGAVLDIAADDVTVKGISVENPNSSGVSISNTSGYGAKASECFLVAGSKGFHSTGNYEAEVYDCRVFNPNSAPAGSIGVHMDGPTDTEIRDSYVIDFDTAIDAGVSSPHQVVGNHTYGPSAMTAGVVVTKGQVSGNYIEGGGGISDAGVIVTSDACRVTENSILVGTGDGIRVDRGGSQTYGQKIVHNSLDSLAGNGGTVVDSNVGGWNRSDVHSNDGGAGFAAQGANGTVSQHVTL